MGGTRMGYAPHARPGQIGAPGDEKPWWSTTGPHWRSWQAPDSRAMRAHPKVTSITALLHRR